MLRFNPERTRQMRTKQMSEAGSHLRKVRRISGERRRSDAGRIVEVLHKRGRIALRVYGTSMLPWIRPGDIAMIRRAETADVRFGDVVLFRRSDHLCVHRIVRKSGAFRAEHFYAKADAHPTGDGRIESQELLGRVVRIYRRGKRIDMDAPGSLATGLLIAQMSLWSRFWYPAARLVLNLTRPMRRLMAMIP
jgi:signal peptidase I